MKTIDATPSINTLLEAWRESLSHVLTDAGLHAPVVETIDAKNAADKIAKISGKRSGFVLKAGGRLAGTLGLLMSQADAQQLGSIPASKQAAEMLGQAAAQVADALGLGLAQLDMDAAPANDAPELVCGGLRIGGENFAPITIILGPSADFVESLRALDEGALAAGFAEVAEPPAVTNASRGPSSNLDLLFDVQLEATIRFGGRQLLLRDILALSTGSAIGLDRQIDEPAELLVAGRLVARGEVVVVDGNFGLRITEVTSSQQRSELLHA